MSPLVQVPSHRGLLGPFMARHGLDAEPDGMHDPAPEHRWTAADLAGLGPEDLRLATAEEGDPYLVGLEDEPPPTESPSSQAHLDHLYAALGVAEEPWEKAFWREANAEQQRGRASAAIDPAPARKPAVVQPAAVLENVVLTAADENPTGPSKQSPLPPIPPARPPAPTVPSVPDPRYYGAERPPDRLQAVRARPPVPVGLTSRDMDLLTRTALGEARGEGDEGMVGVLWTIRNRMELAPKLYGYTPAEIVMKPLQYEANDPKSTGRAYFNVLGMLPGDDDYERAYTLAHDVFTDRRADPTGNAIGFQPLTRDRTTGQPQAIPESMGPHARFTRYIGRHAFVEDPRLKRPPPLYPDSYPGY